MGPSKGFESCFVKKNIIKAINADTSQIISLIFGFFVEFENLE